MTDVVTPQSVQVYYDVEDSYADGGSAGSPDFAWVGIIQDAPQSFTNNKRQCRGIGSVDVNSLADGLQSPEITLKWIVQRKRTVATAFNPATLLAYANTFPTYGLGIEWLTTYGATPSYVSLWYKGMLMDSLDVEFSIDSFITATAKFIGHSIVDGTEGVGNSYATNPINLANSYALPLTGYDAEVFYNAAGGADTALTKVKSVRFSIKNKLRRIPVIQTSNSTYLKYIEKGQRELTGEIVCYMEDKTEYAHLLDATALDIRIDLQKTDNTPYFNFTGCKLDTGSISTNLTTVPCEVTLPFVATGITIA